jgi:Gamma-glutamyl cyclotransferase, AIG2-like
MALMQEAAPGGDQGLPARMGLDGGYLNGHSLRHAVALSARAHPSATGDLRMSASYTLALFSYGTLQLEAVQMQSFGRLLEGRPDAIPGFKKEMIEITDPDVIKLSGERFHLVVSESANSNDEVAGKVFLISAEELEAADRYEVSDYKRIEVMLKSGIRAWVYVKA